MVRTPSPLIQHWFGTRFTPWRRPSRWRRRSQIKLAQVGAIEHLEDRTLLASFVVVQQPTTTSGGIGSASVASNTVNETLTWSFSGGVAGSSSQLGFGDYTVSGDLQIRVDPDTDAGERVGDQIGVLIGYDFYLEWDLDPGYHASPDNLIPTTNALRTYAETSGPGRFYDSEVLGQMSTSGHVWSTAHTPNHAPHIGTTGIVATIGQTFTIHVDAYGSTNVWQGGTDWHGDIFSSGRFNISQNGADIALTGLNWNTRRDAEPAVGWRGVDVDYNIVGDIGDPEETVQIGFYWARGPELKDRIGELRTPLDLGLGTEWREPGSHQFNEPAHWGEKPAAATHVLVVADPQNHLEEIDETNNVLALRVREIDEILSSNAVTWTISGPELHAEFKPGGGQYTMSEAEVALGVDHFNWYQSIIGAPAGWTLTRIDDGTRTDIPLPWVDPFDNSFGDEQVVMRNSFGEELQVNRFAYDKSQLYWDEPSEVRNFTTSNSLRFVDAPRMPADFIFFDEFLEYRTSLRGVDQNGTAVGTLKWVGFNQAQTSLKWKADTVYPGGTAERWVHLKTVPSQTFPAVSGGGVFDVELIAETPPLAADDHVDVGRSAVRIPVLQNDHTPVGQLRIVDVGQPDHGTAAIDSSGTPNDPSDDVIVYTPNADFGGVGTLSYQVQAQAGGPIGTARIHVNVARPFGEVVSLAIPQNSEVKGGLVELTAGDPVFYDSADPNASVVSFITVSLRNAAGETVDSWQYATERLINVPETGLYSVVFTNHSTDGDDEFSYRFLRLADQPVLAIDSGEVTGGFPAPGQAALFRMTGAAGQSVHLPRTFLNGFWQVFAPSGASLVDQVFFTQIRDFVLPETGTYAVAATLYFADPAGFRFNPSTPTTASRGISIGDVVLADIPGTGEFEEFTFAGDGSRVFFTPTSSLEGTFPHIRGTLVSPSGQVIDDWDAVGSAGPWTLSEAGQYSIRLHSAITSSITMAFQLVDVSTLPAIIADGRNYSGNIPDGGAVAFRATATAGQTLSLDMSAGQDAMSLFDPSNKLVPFADPEHGGWDGTIRFAQTGTYLVTFDGRYGAGTYAFSGSTGISRTQALQFETHYNAGALQGTVDLWKLTFTGTAGQRLYFEGGASTLLTLMTASGTEIDRKLLSESLVFEIPEDGSYRFEIPISRATWFRVRDIGAQPALRIAAAMTQASARTNENHIVRQFAGRAGQEFRIDVQSYDEDIDYHWLIYGPSGDLPLAGKRDSSTLSTQLWIWEDVNYTLPETGTYTLVLVKAADWAFSVTPYLGPNAVPDPGLPPAADGFTEINVTANDIAIVPLDATSVRIVTPPEFGYVRVNNDGRLAYFSGAGFVDLDRFEYEILDNNGLSSGSVVVQIAPQASITIQSTHGSNQVSESGSMDTVTVVLDSPPLSNVVLNVTSGNRDEVTVSPASLTFTPMNWNVAQTVTFTGVPDDSPDGPTTTAITISVNDAASDITYDDVPNQNVSVTNLSATRTTVVLQGTGRVGDFIDITTNGNVPIELRATDGRFLARGFADRISLAGYSVGTYEVWVAADPGEFTMTQNTGFGQSTGEPLVAALDLDNSGTFRFNTDGIVLLAHSLGVQGAALEAFRDSAHSRTGTEMETVIAQLANALDLDGDGEFQFATDGIIMLAHALGSQAATLEGFRSPTATRSGDDIEARIDGLLSRASGRMQSPDVVSTGFQPDLSNQEPRPNANAELPIVWQAGSAAEPVNSPQLVLQSPVLPGDGASLLHPRSSNRHQQSAHESAASPVDERTSARLESLTGEKRTETEFEELVDILWATSSRWPFHETQK